MRYIIYKDPIGKYRIQIPELVGDSQVWRLPMDLLNLNFQEYLLLIKTNYHGNIKFYRGVNGKIKFVGIWWDEVHKKSAEAFKNLLNKKLRKI